MKHLSYTLPAASLPKLNAVVPGNKAMTPEELEEQEHAEKYISMTKGNIEGLFSQVLEKMKDKSLFPPSSFALASLVSYEKDTVVFRGLPEEEIFKAPAEPKRMRFMGFDGKHLTRNCRQDNFTVGKIYEIAGEVDEESARFITNRYTTLYERLRYFEPVE